MPEQQPNFLPPHLKAMIAPAGPILLSREQKLDFCEFIFQHFSRMTGVDAWDTKVTRDAEGMTIRITTPD